MAEQVHYCTLPRIKRDRAITESAEADHITDDTATSDLSRTLSKSLDDLSLVFPRPPILAEERAKFTSEVMSKRKKTRQEIEDLRREVIELIVKCDPEFRAGHTYFLNTRTLLQQVFRSGKKKFSSESTSEGMLYLLKKGLVNDTPEDVALCLYAECFDKAAIGKYLGKNDPFRQQVLRCFLRLFDVTGLNFVEAIRELVEKLVLPDEPKYIERIMNEFGKYYHLSNPKKFCSADTCSACAVSLVLLSNNLHSTRHQKVVSVDEYVFMHIQFSSKLSLETLTMFYEAVEKEPFQSTQKEIEHIGPMELERTPGHWKKYEFKLFSEGCLHYWKAQKKSTKTRIISLSGLNVREIEVLSPKKDQFVFELFSVDPSSKVVKIAKLEKKSVVVMEKKSMVIMENGVRFRVKTRKERNDWVAKIRTQLRRLEKGECKSYRSSYISEQTDIEY